jgi:hypothetical protein
MQQAQVFLGCGGMARFLEITESWVRALNIPADALVDGRKAWTVHTAERVKAERQARQRKPRAA